MILTCQELVELITDYLEGALDAGQHAAVARHLSECDGCLRYASQLQQTVRLLASTPSQTLSAADRAAIIAACRDWCTAKVGSAGQPR